jgi:FdhD protein
MEVAINAVKGFDCRCINGIEEQTTPLKVARELPLTLVLNDQELVTLLCTPGDEKYLAAGFLASEGYIKNVGDIKQILADTVRGIVRVYTHRDNAPSHDIMFKRVVASACGRCAAFYNAADSVSQTITLQNKVTAEQVLRLVRQFQSASNLHGITHGAHSAALCDNSNILVINEDIGRHNAVDKVFGRCLLENINVSGKFVILSGRISSEMVYKVTKREIPVIISIAAPTDLGIEICEKLGVTLITTVRNDSMHVFTHAWRVIRDEEQVACDTGKS